MRELTGVRRSRNGRLAIDWLSRRQKPRWRMLSLDGQMYDRDRLRDRVRQRVAQTRVATAAAAGATAAGATAAVVPSTSRPLTAEEVAAVMNTNPWRL